MTTTDTTEARQRAKELRSACHGSEARAFDELIATIRNRLEFSGASWSPEAVAQIIDGYDAFVVREFAAHASALSALTAERDAAVARANNAAHWQAVGEEIAASLQRDLSAVRARLKLAEQQLAHYVKCGCPFPRDKCPSCDRACDACDYGALLAQHATPCGEPCMFCRGETFGQCARLAGTPREASHECGMVYERTGNLDGSGSIKWSHCKLPPGHRPPCGSSEPTPTTGMADPVPVTMGGIEWESLDEARVPVPSTDVVCRYCDAPPGELCKGENGGVASRPHHARVVLSRATSLRLTAEAKAKLAAPAVPTPRDGERGEATPEKLLEHFLKTGHLWERFAEHETAARARLASMTAERDAALHMARMHELAATAYEGSLAEKTARLTELTTADGTNRWVAGQELEMVQALRAERDALSRKLATARVDALEEARAAVAAMTYRMEHDSIGWVRQDNACWTIQRLGVVSSTSTVPGKDE